jgi:DNA topoisomerase-2
MELKYLKMSDIEHVLNRPDSYIGSINFHEKEYYIYNNSLNKFQKETLKYNPGFYNIFDEIITNSIDESKRNKKLNKIFIEVTDSYISITDNGGIPVKTLPEYNNIYIPEFLFGNLRTSSNYDDTQKRNVAGTNGIGAKATAIFSTKFIVHTADGKKSYYQEFLNNLQNKTSPIIKKSSKHFTTIKYFPDLKRFKLSKIDSTHIKIFEKRIYDLAGLYPNINFYFNDKKINIKSFKDYCLLYEIDENNLFIETNEHWNVAISYSTNGFKQISFVNGNQTFDGGTHVNYIFDQIVNHLRPYIKKKYKLDIKPYEIRNNLFLIISADIINNKYTSQTKEKLNTEIKDFGNYIELTQKVLSKIIKSEILNRTILWKKAKDEINEKIELKKLNKSIKKIKIPNLIDCSTKNRKDAELFIFEGMSAGSASVKYRNPKTQAIFLLKGKILNTFDINVKKIFNNVQMSGLTSAIGLTIGDPDISNLRYNRILITTDADHDGDNIASLLINFFAYNWIDLFKQEKIYRVLTPLLIIKTKNKQYDIYSNDEFEKIKESLKNTSYKIFYKKGLGALSNEDYKKMITKPRLLKITYDDNYLESLKTWFSNDKEKRKEILIK